MPNVWHRVFPDSTAGRRRHGGDHELTGLRERVHMSWVRSSRTRAVKPSLRYGAAGGLTHVLNVESGFCELSRVGGRWRLPRPMHVRHEGSSMGLWVGWKPRHGACLSLEWILVGPFSTRCLKQAITLTGLPRQPLWLSVAAVASRPHRPWSDGSGDRRRAGPSPGVGCCTKRTIL